MPSIVSVGTAVPPYAIEQEEARQLAEAHFSGRISNLRKYLTVFEHALVDQRHLCAPPEWLLTERGVGSRNQLYIEWAEKLAVRATKECFEGASVHPSAVTHVVFVSSTGIAAPSIDVAVIQAMNLRAEVRRIPLFGLGCAGGAAGIAISGTLAKTTPGAVVLLVSVELDSLTFQPEDYSKSNLVAASLFGDGAAAVLIRDTGGALEVLDSLTRLRSGTRGLMGWDFVDTGFQVRFSRRVPMMVREMTPKVVSSLLGPHGLVPNDLTHFIVHPGGRRILEAYEELFGKGSESLDSSYAVLRRFGNMSSATVLFVLAEELRRGNARPGDIGLLAAFGPGFSAEATLLRWG